MTFTQKYNLKKKAGMLENLGTAFKNLSQDEQAALIGGGIGSAGGILTGSGVGNSLLRGVVGGGLGAGAGYGGSQLYDAYNNYQAEREAELDAQAGQTLRNTQQAIDNEDAAPVYDKMLRDALQREIQGATLPSVDELNFDKQPSVDVSGGSKVNKDVFKRLAEKTEDEKMMEGGVTNPQFENAPSNISLDPAYSEGTAPEDNPIFINNADSATRFVEGSNPEEMILDAKLQAAAQGKSTSEFLMYLINNADQAIKNIPEDTNVITR